MINLIMQTMGCCLAGGGNGDSADNVAGDGGGVDGDGAGLRLRGHIMECNQTIKYPFKLTKHL